MNLGDFIRGLTTLQGYYDNPYGYHIGAEHDQFYAYPTDSPVSEDDFRILKGWGWFQVDVEDEDVYEPNAGWSAFV